MEGWWGGVKLIGQWWFFNSFERKGKSIVVSEGRNTCQRNWNNTHQISSKQLAINQGSDDKLVNQWMEWLAMTMLGMLGNAWKCLELLGKSLKRVSFQEIEKWRSTISFQSKANSLRSIEHWVHGKRGRATCVGWVGERRWKARREVCVCGTDMEMEMEGGCGGGGGGCESSFSILLFVGRWII